jgi:glycine cleavage system aminomethyltransferase T/glycine/D-amino acid oxidase-like deaminating enzyme
MNTSLPTETRIVIVGGGIVGSSLAYHLTKLGCRDVVLLEQNRFAGGTTWHAAGLVGRLRTSNSLTRINKESAALYSRLEEETGHPVGWKQVGSLIVGRSEDRMVQLRRTASMAELFGVEVRLITPEEALEKWPFLRIEDLKGAAWLPHDGKVIPQEVTLALVKGARAGGATALEEARVTEILHRQGRATGVRTTGGTIQAETVVLCGGMWTRELGLRCGVDIPLYPVEHHYVVTQPIEGVRDDLPVGRDPDLCIYFRGEGQAIMLGAFPKSSRPWNVDRVPDDFSFRLLEPDWEKFSDPLAAGKWRLPVLEKTPFDRFVNGPESFTPDNHFLMGETPSLRHLYVAAGFNSVGIASAGGAGKYLAEWILEGQPTLDLWSVDIRRFGPVANNTEFLRERVAEVLGLHYQMAWPNREFETGRGVRRSPLHDRLAAQGACFGAKAGWERPNWFARGAMKPVVEYSFGRQNWFDCHAAEHRAAREHVAVFDQSAFAKFILSGPDALEGLQTLCGNDVDVSIGRAVYTGLFNEGGGFESDLTVIRTGEQEFYIVSGTAQAVHDAHWIRRHIPESARAGLVDVTNAHAVLGVMGPNACALLGRVTDANLSNEAFPFGTSRWIGIGPAQARAVRLTYVGELGWELHVPTDQAPLVYDRLMEAGRDLGAVNAGHYAINSLRLEKGYRAWGADVSPEDNPLEAGLSFAVAWKKSAPFLGKQALLELRERLPQRRLVLFVVQDPEPVLWGNEPILRNGVAVGYTTSGSYGHTLGGAVGLGYVRDPEGAGVSAEFIKAGQYEIDINGRLYPALPHLRAPYDPERKRLMA